MKILDYAALTLVIIGAINWGLIGFFSFDLVRVLFGDMSLISRIVYALVGVSGLYALSYFGRLKNEMQEKKIGGNQLYKQISAVCSYCLNFKEKLLRNSSHFQVNHFHSWKY